MLGAVLRCLEQFFPGVNTFWILLPGARWFWRKVPTQHNKKGAWKPYGYFIWTHLMLIQALLLALAKKHQAADYQQKVQILALYLSLSTWIPTEKNPNWALKKSGSRNQSDKKPLTFSNRPWPRVGETSWCFGDLRPPGTEAEAKVVQTWDPNLSTETEPIQVDLGDETTHPLETTWKNPWIFMGRFLGIMTTWKNRVFRWWWLK